MNAYLEEHPLTGEETDEEFEEYLADYKAGLEDLEDDD